MAARTLLSLDLSTTCTGWAVLDIDTRQLISFGRLRPTTKGGVAKMTYPRQQLTKMVDLANQVLELIKQVGPHRIVIEEIAGSKNRLGQKTLDGFHFVVVMFIEPYLDIVSYQDVTGARGWRSAILGLRLSEADKSANKSAKRLNKKLASRQQIPIIGPKHLAARYVNARFGLALNVDVNPLDADIADAVAMGDAFLAVSYPRVAQDACVETEASPGNRPAV